MSSIPMADANPPSRQGPATLQEQENLLRLGREAFGRGHNAEAARLLQRFVDRYPGTPGYLEAHQVLGLAYLRLGNAGQALKPLRYYVDARPWTSESFRARIALAHAYQGMKKFDEGLQVSNEIVQPRISNPQVPREVFLEGLLLKSWSFLGLNRELDALQAVDAFASEEKKQSVTGRIDLQAQSERLRVELKSRECNRILGQGPMNEGDVRVLIKKRGTCLLEALTHFYQSLKTGNEKWSLEASNTLSKSFELYAQVCRQPPHPPGKRTPIQLKRYREELIVILEEDCSDLRDRARVLLNDWQKGLSPSMGSLASRLSAKIANR